MHRPPPSQRRLLGWQVNELLCDDLQTQLKASLEVQTAEEQWMLLIRHRHHLRASAVANDSASSLASSCASSRASSPASSRVSSHAPSPELRPLPEGYQLGDRLYFVGEGQRFRNGDRLVHAQQGEVVGGSIGSPSRLLLHFDGNRIHMSCTLDVLSRTPPWPLPGGYAPGERLYYTGKSETLHSGNQLTHAQPGEVMGPVVGHLDELSMHFEGNRNTIALPRGELSRTRGFMLGYTRYMLGSSPASEVVREKHASKDANSREAATSDVLAEPSPGAEGLELLMTEVRARVRVHPPSPPSSACGQLAYTRPRNPGRTSGRCPPRPRWSA